MIKRRRLWRFAVCTCALLLAPAALSANPSPDRLVGKVIDRDSGVPISGATIEARDPQLGSAPFAATTSKRNGAYALVLPRRARVLIIVDSGSNGYAAFHGLLDAGITPDFLKVIALSRLSADEAAWLQRVNDDRAAWHVRRVTMDEAALLAARRHARDMALQGYLGHTDGTGLQPWERFSSLNGIGGDYENVGRGEDATFADIEDAFLAEGPPRQPGRCTHFTTLLDPKAVWAGLAVVREGRTASRMRSSQVNYFDQELIEYPY